MASNRQVEPGPWMDMDPGCCFWTRSSASGMLLVSSRQKCQIIINKTPAGTTQKALLIWAALPVPLIGWIPCESYDFCAGIGGGAVFHSPLFARGLCHLFPGRVCASKFNVAVRRRLPRLAHKSLRLVSAFPQTNNSLFIHGKPTETASCWKNILHNVTNEL